jgi:hypothetical protein
MKGQAKTKYDYKKEHCDYTAPAGYCKLPKYKRCADCIRIKGGGKACMVEL